MNNNKGFNQNMNNNMNNMNNMNYDGISKNFDTEDYLYPEIYHQMMPMIDQMIKDMEKKYGEIYLTEDLMKQITDEAIRRSGIDTTIQPPFDMKEDDAIMTINEFGHGRHGRHHRNFHNRDSFSDIFRILFLQQLFGRRRPRWRWR